MTQTARIFAGLDRFDGARLLTDTEKPYLSHPLGERMLLNWGS
jgi:hypothetical protein